MPIEKFTKEDMEYIEENLKVSLKEDDPVTAILRSIGRAGQLSNRRTKQYKKDRKGSAFLREKPVDTRTFFRDFVKEENYPLQQAMVDAVFGLDPSKWDTTYEEYVLLWGMGSGKDHTVGKVLTYAAYWIKHLADPQQYFGLGSGTSIDLANMCINARLAKNVFFDDFKNTVQRTIIPGTNRNWFEAHGVDVRDGKDIKTNEINFGQGITAHSLNSETQSDIGMNPLMVVFDEIGGFDVANAEELYNYARRTQASRFAATRSHKRLLLSFKRSDNDFMMIRYQESENQPKTFRSKASTWEVNKRVTKDDLAEEYAADPEGAKRVYECEGELQEGGYFKYKKTIPHVISKEKGKNPIVDNLHRIRRLTKIEFKDWFVGDFNKRYYAHVDLGTGDDNDCAGLAVVHSEPMYVDFNDEYKLELIKEGIDIVRLMKSKRMGVVCDIAIQITALPGREVQFADLIDFILRLRDERFFTIGKVTYDGFSSIGERQRLKQKGIESDLLSIDRDCVAYDTLKSLVYTGLFKSYMNPILIRELDELVYVPNAKGEYTRRKIDHPKHSLRRRREEGSKKGSKDVSDGVAGAAFNCVDAEKANFSFGFIDVVKNKEDFMHPKEVEREQFETMQDKVRTDKAEETRLEMIKDVTGGKKDTYWKTLIGSY